MYLTFKSRLFFLIPGKNLYTNEYVAIKLVSEPVLSLCWYKNLIMMDYVQPCRCTKRRSVCFMATHLNITRNYLTPIQRTAACSWFSESRLSGCARVSQRAGRRGVSLQWRLDWKSWLALLLSFPAESTKRTITILECYVCSIQQFSAAHSTARCPDTDVGILHLFEDWLNKCVLSVKKQNLKWSG